MQNEFRDIQLRTSQEAIDAEIDKKSEIYFNDFLILGEECLSILDRIGQFDSSVLTAECNVQFTLPANQRFSLYETRGASVVSRLYSGNHGDCLLSNLGEETIHDSENPFYVKSARIIADSQKTRLILCEDIFEEDDKERLGRRSIIDTPSVLKEIDKPSPEYSREYLINQFHNFIDLSIEAYRLEKRYPENYNEHSRAQLNIHFTVPNGWMMSCHPRAGSSLSEMSDFEAMMVANHASKHFGQYTKSNPFLAEWAISESIPGYGIWAEYYLLGRGYLHDDRTTIPPQQVTDIIFDFVKNYNS